MHITKALADENRVRILLTLRGGELCVCQITELFGLAPSSVSRQLSILYRADLAESRKEGLCSLDGGIGQREPARGEEAARLKMILAMAPVEL